MNTIRLFAGIIAAVLGLVVLTPVLLLMAPLVIVWAAHRALVRLFEPVMTPDPQMVEFEPAIGWRPKARLNIYALADDLYRTSTDADGWRGKTPLGSSRVIVFGDSFAFGHAIGDKGFFADLNPSLQVKAIGVDGYNLVQELMWMRRLSADFAGKMIVWFIFLGNDLFENLQPCMEGYRTPFVRRNRVSGEWEIVTDHVNPTPWRSGRRYYESIFMEKFAGMFVAGPVSDRLFEACEYLFEEAQRTVHECGGRLVILTIPAKRQLSDRGRNETKGYLSNPAVFDPDLPDIRLQRVCAKLGIPFVAGKDHLDVSDYHEHEVHWNAKGHRRIANLLLDLDRRFGTSPASPVSSPSDQAVGIGVG